MRTIALPVNLLSEGSRQKISDFEPWLLRSGKAYQTIRSFSMLLASFSLCILMLPTIICFSISVI